MVGVPRLYRVEPQGTRRVHRTQHRQPASAEYSGPRHRQVQNLENPAVTSHSGAADFTFVPPQMTRDTQWATHHSSV